MSCSLLVSLSTVIIVKKKIAETVFLELMKIIYIMK